MFHINLSLSASPRLRGENGVGRIRRLAQILKPGTPQGVRRRDEDSHEDPCGGRAKGVIHPQMTQMATDRGSGRPVLHLCPSASSVDKTSRVQLPADVDQGVGDVEGQTAHLIIAREHYKDGKAQQRAQIRHPDRHLD